MERNCDNKLCSEIGDSGIFYCMIPHCDCDVGCENCDLYNVDALTALANEIVKIKMEVKK